MNKSLHVAVKTVTWIIMCAIVITASASDVSTKATDVSKRELKDRIASLPSAVDLRYSDEVHNIINTYIKGYRRGAERLLGLSEQYFPVYESELAKRNLPQELKYLSIVESGLRPHATSATGAAGLWQFMKATARLYGLRINDTVDERRDVVKSTQAATEYLHDLYEQFGDWTLALAAYNCGPGNVRRALRQSNEEEFWSMKRRGFLPRETRRYLPKYVAVSYVMSYSQEHELYPTVADLKEKLATVKIFDYTTFSEISKFSGMDRSDIVKYNRAFLKGYIPRSTDGYYLTLPETAMYEYLAHKGGFEHLEDFGVTTTQLQGEYLIHSAMQRQRVELQQLWSDPSVRLFAKPISNHRMIMPTLETPAYAPAPKRRMHTLRPEESVQDVAKAHGLSLAALLRLNSIDPSQMPAPGTDLFLDE